MCREKLKEYRREKYAHEKIADAYHTNKVLPDLAR